MIDYETYARIRNFVIKDRLNINQIAEEPDLDQRTAAR